MNENHESGWMKGREGAEAMYLARLDRLLRTVERMRSLAERIETASQTEISNGSSPAPLAAVQADAGELRSLADDLVLLGYTFREAQIEPTLRMLANWARGFAAAELRCTGDALQIDHRLLPVLREQAQELMQLLLDLHAAQTEPGTPAHLHLDASVRGRSLAFTLTCDEVELGSAEMMHAARKGGLSAESPEALLRHPGRLVFSPAFAAGWGLPAGWSERLLRLRERLRREHGDLRMREAGAGQWAFSLTLPMIADLVPVLVVRSGGEAYALPIDAVFSTRMAEPSEWRSNGGQLWLEQAMPAPAEGFEQADWAATGPVSAAPLHQVLDEEAGMPAPSSPAICVLLEDGDGMAALVVEEVLGERQVLLRHPRQLLRRAPLLMGSFLLPAEEICVVLNPWDLLQRMRTFTVTAPR